jgi:F-type H+-transporting ATPase subunit b
LPAIRTGVAATVLVLAPSLAHAAEGGLSILPDVKRLVVLLVLFLVLLPILNALLFQPLLRALEARDARIAGARARAADLAQQAATLLARHDDAIRQARERAHAEQVQIVEQARSDHHAAVGAARGEAERQLAEARVEITQAATGVRGSLQAEAESIAREIAARMLGRSAA